MYPQPPPEPRRPHYPQQPGPEHPYYQQPPADSWQQQTDGPYRQPPSYQPPGPPQPPYGYQLPGPPRRKRHRGLKIFAGIGGAFVLLIVIVAIASSGGGNGSTSGTAASSSSATQAAQAAAPAAGTPHIGQPAADGKFRFVITRVSHATSVGDTADGLGKTAQGRYTVLHIKVTNISNQSQTLDDSSQYVYDASGRKFDADSDADLYANPGNGGGVLFNTINPGNTVRGVILFDLPRGDKAVKAELHDSMFSGGATVSLTH